MTIAFNRFVAIDFETANYRRDSACSVWRKMNYRIDFNCGIDYIAI